MIEALTIMMIGVAIFWLWEFIDFLRDMHWL